MIVCGTAFMMSEVRSTLGLEDQRDADHFQSTSGTSMMRDAQVSLLDVTFYS